MNKVEKFIRRVTGSEGQICLSFPQTHIGFFFLHSFGCYHLNLVLSKKNYSAS